MRSIKKTNGLSGLKYCLLGLGDTNYDEFCKAAKKLDGLLQKAGATQIIPTAFADDGTALELVVEPWRKNAKEAIISCISKSELPEGQQESSANTQHGTESKRVCFLYASQTGNATVYCMFFFSSLSHAYDKSVDSGYIKDVTKYCSNNISKYSDYPLIL